MVGTDAHDRLYLDANGNIQYLNLQSGGGTPDDYSFVLDEDGHNQNNLPFSKKLDNRNQVKIKKISMIFHGFYCTLKIPEEKALFFRVV